LGATESGSREGGYVSNVSVYYVVLRFPFLISVLIISQDIDMLFCQMDQAAAALAGDCRDGGQGATADLPSASASTSPGVGTCGDHVRRGSKRSSSDSGPVSVSLSQEITSPEVRVCLF
jgi:hypothetical protein